MFDQAECDRITQGAGIAPLSNTAAWVFELSFDQGAQQAIARILEVVRVIVCQDTVEWPQEDEWRARFPDWLNNYIRNIPKEESAFTIANTPREKWSELPWDFRSWLDAIRERGWQWWGYALSDDRARVIVLATSMPPRIAALKQVFLAAGASVLAEHEF